MEQVENRRRALRAELAGLEGSVIDESDLRSALASFDPVWAKLTSDEKARVVRLLLETVSYDAEASTVEMTFRPCGVRALAAEDERRTA